MYNHPRTAAALCKMKKTLLFPPKRVKFEVTEGTVHAVGADAPIGPAGHNGTTQDLGEFAAAQRAAVGIGTYKHAAYRNEYAKHRFFWIA